MILTDSQIETLRIIACINPSSRFFESIFQNANNYGKLSEKQIEAIKKKYPDWDSIDFYENHRKQIEKIFTQRISPSILEIVRRANELNISSYKLPLEYVWIQLFNKLNTANDYPERYWIIYNLHKLVYVESGYTRICKKENPNYNYNYPEEFDKFTNLIKNVALYEIPVTEVDYLNSLFR